MQPSSDVVVHIDNISKAFGSLKAVDALSFEVYRGEIFGLLGPNGAGKTTTLTIIEGLRSADAGSVGVLSMDIFTDTPAIKARIGVQWREQGIFQHLALTLVPLPALVLGAAVAQIITGLLQGISILILGVLLGVIAPSVIGLFVALGVIFLSAITFVTSGNERHPNLAGQRIAARLLCYPWAQPAVLQV